MDNFYGKNFKEMTTVANSLGFTIATSADVDELTDTLSLTGGEWPTYKSTFFRFLFSSESALL